MRRETAVIGDIHGNATALATALSLIPSDVAGVVFVGDYVNRGPHSRQVVEALLRFRRSRPGVTFLRGNHDQAFLRCLDDGDLIPFLAMGGSPTIKSYVTTPICDVLSELRGSVPPDHVQFLRTLKDTFEVDGLLVTHDASSVMRERKGPRFVIGGHAVQRDLAPRRTASGAIIDTGCGTLQAGRLCCYLWPSHRWALVGPRGEVVKAFRHDLRRA